MLRCCSYSVRAAAHTGSFSFLVGGGGGLPRRLAEHCARRWFFQANAEPEADILAGEACSVRARALSFSLSPLALLLLVRVCVVLSRSALAVTHVNTTDAEPGLAG